ncbi:MAG: Gfo/Idh/MocA family oxidoreductase [Salana multivorans]|nr:Gfo/Idh/MocA family oxidoreductase [Salana multivorans]MBN8883897.1 Gfo/Idh/MocA family oxidoreductase [Salana multivorans]
MGAQSGPVLRVALVGAGFMGRAHSHAWRTAGSFFDLPRRPELAVLVGRDRERADALGAGFGWRKVSTDWRDVVARDDVDVVDICTPGDLHAEIAVAALEAGKHVLCEKPLANSVVEAETMTAAAEAAARRSGTVAMCGFSYRRTPALALARELLAAGALGEVRHVRAQYLQDWLVDPDAPMTWRLDAAKAGSGTLGDIGAHSIDTAQWLLGSPIRDVSAVLRTFVPTRPTLTEQVGLGGRGRVEGEREAVTVDDAAAFTARFATGALGVFEATRMATGRRNANRIEINGTLGSVAFDYERSNELEVYDATAPGPAGFRRVLATEPEHPYMSAWWPTGHGIGYEHGFTHQVVDLVRAIAGQGEVSPSFAEALQVQRVLDAVQRSAADESRLTSVALD